MRTGQFQNFVEARVTVLADGERIEGHLFHMGGTRLSDFLNSSSLQESKFLRVKNPTVYGRRTSQELTAVPFLMVARDRIVMVMTYSPTEAESDDPFAHEPAVEPANRIL